MGQRGRLLRSTPPEYNFSTKCDSSSPPPCPLGPHLASLKMPNCPSGHLGNGLLVGKSIPSSPKGRSKGRGAVELAHAPPEDP